LIKIRNDFFYPSYLKVTIGDIVEWKVSEDYEEKNENSLFYFNNRSHVISFDNLNAESYPLNKNSDGYKVRFLKKGVYNFQC